MPIEVSIVDGQHPRKCGAIVREPVDSLADLPHPGPVDPAAEVRRGGDVRTHGHDMACNLLGFVRQIGEEPPERLLGGRGSAMAATEVLG